MFISVNQGLPKTSYIKMVDIWLIFMLLLPFFEVLLHTYIDTLRGDDEEREINHHGEVVTVGGKTSELQNAVNLLLKARRIVLGHRGVIRSNRHYFGISKVCLSILILRKITQPHLCGPIRAQHTDEVS